MHSVYDKTSRLPHSPLWAWSSSHRPSCSWPSASTRAAPPSRSSASGGPGWCLSLAAPVLQIPSPARRPGARPGKSSAPCRTTLHGTSHNKHLTSRFKPPCVSCAFHYQKRAPLCQKRCKTVRIARYLNASTWFC